ncbi:MAG: hypothetical protein WC645_08570, partial [Candidatus Margulisiibacteriota bacterium]
MKKVIQFLSILVFVSFISGCAAAAIGYMGHKMSEARAQSAEKLQRSMDLRTYAQYRVGMEKVNLDREKAGFKPNPVMTQEGWISAQTAGRPAI